MVSVSYPTLKSLEGRLLPAILKVTVLVGKEERAFIVRVSDKRLVMSYSYGYFAYHQRSNPVASVVLGVCPWDHKLGIPDDTTPLSLGGYPVVAINTVSERVSKGLRFWYEDV